MWSSTDSRYFQKLIVKDSHYTSIFICKYSSNDFPILVVDSQHPPSGHGATIDMIHTKSSNDFPIPVGNTQHTPTHIPIDRSNSSPLPIHYLKLLGLNHIRNTLNTYCKHSNYRAQQTPQPIDTSP